VPDGPLFLRGDIELKDGEGCTIRRDTRMALCRCGQSRNKPFCDNTHRLTGFRDAGVLGTLPHHDSPADPTPAPEDAAQDFDTAQQRLMEEIGQALIGQSSGTVALELVATHRTAGDGGSNLTLSLERHSAASQCP
jgi:CDGSH-type Zn-finger protein